MSKLFAAKAVELALPGDGLFVEESAYNWRAADEFSLASFYTGEIRKARAMTEELLSASQSLGSERGRLEKNLLFYQAAEVGVEHGV